MAYTEEEIKNYLEFLRNSSDESKMQNPPPAGGFWGLREALPPAKCVNCENRTSFTIDFGYKICDECGITNGHVLGYYDAKDFDRRHYRKKSVYQRKYYYEKKVNKITKIINLSNEQKNELYSRLMEIDNFVMKILNKEYNRKRMISIEFLIKKLLDEMGSEASKLINLKISPQTLNKYENWWTSYKSLKTG